MARQAAAQARGARVGAATKAKNSVSAALEAFDRMEERTIRAEVEAEVIRDSDPQMMLDSGDALSLEAESTLSSLKARVAKELPSGQEKEPDDAPEKRSAIDDSLADLKAKLQ